ncbi:hypothetical protein LCGC14_0520690 [marine sediment metagenome]|uniref:DUF6438 domain-containing protein n=1 Tax=marine sediment metagenome TaxID=412755 RepID=A0A0F9RYK8_9ZZZZ
MKGIKSLSLLFLISLSIFACSDVNRKDSKKVNDDMTTEVNLKSNDVSVNSDIDYSNVLLTVERGAFHFDKFILKDTVITFYPSSESFSAEDENYNQISEQIIRKQARNEFVKKIIEDGFFKLKDSYSNNTSDNSYLAVTFKFNNQSKQVVSDDFERECPELLKFIEQEIIRLHNKNLTRVILPG